MKNKAGDAQHNHIGTVLIFSIYKYSIFQHVTLKYTLFTISKDDDDDDESTVWTSFNPLFPLEVDRERVDNCYGNLPEPADDAGRCPLQYINRPEGSWGNPHYYSWTGGGLAGAKFSTPAKNPSATLIRCVTVWRHRRTWVSVRGEGEGPRPSEKRQPRRVDRDGRGSFFCRDSRYS